MRDDSDDLSADLFAQILLRVPAKWLSSFRRIDGVQPDSDRGFLCCQDVDRVAVDDSDDFAGDLVGLFYRLCRCVWRRWWRDWLDSRMSLF